MDNDKDQELFQIFLEEATDLVASLSNIMQEWEHDIHNLSKIADLKRELHTLKGSARMMGQVALGALAHEMETLSEAMNKGDVKIERNIVQQISLALDRIVLMLEAIKQNANPPDGQDVIQTFQQIIQGGGTKAIGSTPVSISAAQASIPEPLLASEKEQEQKATASKPANAMEEMIRIRATLLETLNMLSTESNMIRVGFEQHVSTLGENIKTFKIDVKRLTVQLNNLSSQLQSFRTESEILHTTDSEDEINSEMLKKYSELDERTHVLRETSGDLTHALKEINECHANMEALLLNQTRISSELQHRLTDTRLVPFASIVPRLSRITRQVSMEVKKQIDFKVLRSEGEMDRILLEHLLPSLEHILRNAIDHGIELEEERIKKGKSPIGKIEVKFSRTGSLAAIEIQDDGAGIDPEIIRKKAIKLGLLASDQKISDAEALRYILEPGFSTRETVSLVSGRGVGMDVVATAVKEMGGTLNIESEKGRGTCMIIRFPFTSSLNRVLLFNIQDKLFGMLLSDIQGITSLSAEEIKKRITTQETIVQHADRSYHLIYLATLLTSQANEIYLAKNKSFPIILLPSAEYPLAVIVDAVQNTRELLIQSLGGQFKLANECSGATLLGDGRVVYILDREALVQKAANRDVEATNQAALLFTSDKPASALPIVLVVDDSTSARAVAKCLLEKEHYKVITANDGLDALKEIELQLPDLILLDIDMPRMDGFELAAALKQEARYKNIPILILTAMVSSERRQQAKELKLEGFIPKPYEGAQLLLTIQSLIGKKS